MAPSLKKGRFCNLPCCLASLIQSLSWMSPLGTQDHILLSEFFYSPNVEVKFLYLNPPWRGWPRYTPALGALSVISYDSQGYVGGILTRLHKTRVETG
jgi:hypothetical protein